PSIVCPLRLSETLSAPITRPSPGQDERSLSSVVLAMITCPQVTLLANARSAAPVRAASNPAARIAAFKMKKARGKVIFTIPPVGRSSASEKIVPQAVLVNGGVAPPTRYGERFTPREWR